MSDKRYDHSPLRLLETVGEVVDLIDSLNATADSGTYSMSISGDDIAPSSQER